MRAQLHKPSANPNDDSEKAIKANVIEWNELVEKFVRSASIPQPYKPYTRAISISRDTNQQKKNGLKARRNTDSIHPSGSSTSTHRLVFPSIFTLCSLARIKSYTVIKFIYTTTTKIKISVFQIYVRAKTRQIYLLCWSGQQLPYDQVRSYRTGSTQFSSIYTVFSVAKQSHLLLKARRSRTAADFYRVWLCLCVWLCAPLNVVMSIL